MDIRMNLTKYFCCITLKLILHFIYMIVLMKQTRNNPILLNINLKTSLKPVNTAAVVGLKKKRKCQVNCVGRTSEGRVSKYIV